MLTVPPCAIATVSVGVKVVKVAVTVLLAVIDIVQVAALGASQPSQLAKLDPLAAAAVSAIDVPLVNVSLQSVPHEMPGPVTVPEPGPAFATVRVTTSGGLTPPASLEPLQAASPSGARRNAA